MKKLIEDRPRFHVLACEILQREVCLCAARSPAINDLTFLPKGLHDLGEKKMKERLQQAIDAVDPDRYDAILLGYGLCNHGVRGLTASLPIVIPRAHDCITLLLGSKERYQEHFEQASGTYFKSPGWMERETDQEETGQSIQSQLGLNRTYAEYVQAYGKENADYLMETLGDLMQQYQRLAYIDTGTGDSKADIQACRQLASERNWEFESLQGDVGLLLKLLSGQWDPSLFQIIDPGKSIAATFDESIVGSSE